MRDTDLESLTDRELLRRLSALTGQARRVEADLVAHIGEVDVRRLFAREGAASMFDYCRRVLGLRENEAYLRITAARATRQHPRLLEMLADGRLHLSGIAKLARHLTHDNRDAVLARASGMSHRQVKELVAELEPRPDVPSRIRKLPEPAARSVPALATRPVTASEPAKPEPSPLQVGAHRVEAARPAPPPVVEPLSPARHRVQFTASTGLREKLERLQDLLRSTIPDGDLAAVIEVAVTEKIARLEAKRYAQTARPRKTLRDTPSAPTSRQAPAAVQRTVYQRDGAQCTYVSPSGRRCTARAHLEFHHDGPYGLGGDHSVSNVRLLCTVHNRLLAERDYGIEKMAAYRRSGKVVSEAGTPYAPSSATATTTHAAGFASATALP